MSQRRPLVPKPCHEDWDKLTPVERGHFCTVCETKVWDLSSLTKEEADEFLRSTEGDLCVSYKERTDGEVVHREAPVVPLSRLVRRLPAAASFSLALAACTPSGQADGKDAQQDATHEAKPKPEADQDAKPEVDEEAPTTAVDEPEPEPKPDPDVRHVKGKWAAPDDPEDERKPEPEEEKPTTEQDRGPKPHIKKGKVAGPHD